MKHAHNSVRDDRGARSTSTSVVYARKKTKDKAPICETEVQRSYRLQEANKGFRGKVCKDKNWLPSSTDPAALPSRVIKNLYISFSKANDNDCTDEMLFRRKKKKETKGTTKEVQKKPAIFRP